MKTKVSIIAAIAGLIVVSVMVGTPTASAQGPSTQHPPCRAMTNLFRALEMSPPQLRDYLAHGGTFEDLAAARDIDLDAVEAQWQADMTACVERAVAEGHITPERARAVIAALESGELTGIPRGNPDSFFDVFTPGVNHPGERESGQPANAPPTEEVGLYDSPGDDTIGSSGQDGVSPDVIDPVRPPAQGGDSQAGEGVFSPGGWGVTDNPPQGEGVFMPGGWHWVDDPQFNDVSQDADQDWIGHPYYAGVFSPGGWGVVGDHAPGSRIDHPNGDNVTR